MNQQVKSSRVCWHARGGQGGGSLCAEVRVCKSIVVRRKRPLTKDAPVVRHERRQVYEFPLLRLGVRDHQALHVRCPDCYTETDSAFPAEVPGRA